MGPLIQNRFIVTLYALFVRIELIEVYISDSDSDSDAQQHCYFLCHIGFMQMTHIAATYYLLLFSNLTPVLNVQLFNINIIIWSFDFDLHLKN